MYSFLVFIIAITLLVGVHEYGHFLLARLCKVQVLQFSLGFGPALWRRHAKSGVEYRIGMIPLGGYVKMLDERAGPLPEAQQHNAFNRQPVWKRTIILLAGPVFNLVFAFVIYWSVAVIGYPQVVPRIGTISPGSIAAATGLKTGEQILQIGSEATHSWNDVEMALVENNGAKEPITLKVSDKNHHTRTLALNLNQWVLDDIHPDPLGSLGIEPYFPNIPPVVDSVESDSPAERAGLLAEDKIIAINHHAISNWRMALDTIQANPNKTVVMTVERAGKNKSMSVTLDSHRQDGKDIGYLGVSSQPIDWPPGMLHQVRYSVIDAIIPAAQKTNDSIMLTLKLLGKLVTGNLSWHGLSGPIGIAQAAGSSASLGIVAFLFFLAMVSVSLGVVNLMPIPILDGGQLVFCWIESIIRRPIPERVQIIGMQIGIIFMLGVMTLALYNDIIRLQ